MATRENLKKLSIDNLRKLATYLNINTTLEKKMISLAQSCSHIGGLLIAFSNSPSSKQQQEDKSCSSLPCRWKVPRTVNQKAQPLNCLDLSRPKINNYKPEKITTSIATFDPQCFPPIEISMELVTFMEKETSDHKQNQMWKDLHIGRNTSSMFGDVLRWNSSQEYLVKQILDRGSLDRMGTNRTTIEEKSEVLCSSARRDSSNGSTMV
ncbi:unnamed protein product [Mytilus edulis]|uniref:Uncharacterized protein n=1 Tax=Mytilus edulis TaxID=6550 RepID=A0A8S3VCY7_MYTED|nr:unnamed protein product [Mytilus edulis]